MARTIQKRMVVIKSDEEQQTRKLKLDKITKWLRFKDQRK